MIKDTHDGWRPDTGELEVSYETTGGHGIAFDAWGRMFGTHNLNHVQHMVFPTWYLTRNPWLAVPTTRDMVSDHESSAMLYQVSPPQTRVNHPEQAGRFSGGSGIGYYGGGALPALIVRVDLDRGRVHVRSLAAETPPDRSLELWYIHAGTAPRSLGLITDATETLTVPSDLRSDAPDATLAVTVEPKGGAPGGKATGPVIYSGRLIRE